MGCNHLHEEEEAMLKFSLTQTQVTLVLIATLALTSCAVRNRTTRMPVTIVAADEITATPAKAPQATPAVSTTTAAPTSSNPGGKIPSLALEKLVDGFTRPVYLTHANDDSGWLYVVEQPGRIQIVQAGKLTQTPFIDLTDRVGSSGNEQGLLSVAFAQDYKTSGLFFVNYTDKNGDTIVSRFKANQDHATADPQSELAILKIDQPYSNHNGGQLQFGPDGMLYIGMGDGGSQGDPEDRAQNPQELLGKLLRIDVSKASAAAPYAIPADNPKWDINDIRPEIWAMGMRNPWRFSFDRTTGDLYTGDVGQNQIEEVDFQPAKTGGLNYGWNLREGLQAYDSGEKKPAFTEPVVQYDHGNGCSVTGGYVYRGKAIPALQGVYVYGDYCNGNMWTLRRDANGAWVNEALPNAGFQISSFGEDANGELYVLDLDGKVYRVTSKA